MNNQTQITYSSSYQNSGSKSIDETLDPFRRQYSAHVRKFSSVCSEFIDSKSVDERKLIAEKYGFDYDFLKEFCKNKYEYNL